MIRLYAIIAILLLLVPAVAYASEPEIIDIDKEKQTIVFLTGQTCADDLEQLSARLPDYWVVCAYRDGRSMEVDPNVAWARMHLSHFETMYHVVYVQNEYYELTKDYKVAGITFGNYAISIPYDIVIEHERLHMVCGCHHTPDGYHD